MTNSMDSRDHDDTRVNATTRRQWLKAALAAGAGGFFAQRLGCVGESHAQPTPAPNAVAKSLIVLWMNGGPSHIDTFDPKSGKEGGPFKAIATRAPGVKICEHLPQLAAQADKLAIVRSMTSKEGSHQRARYFGHTGYAPNPTVKYPAIGSWLSSERQASGALPRFISLGGPSASAGFLGVQHGPFVMSKPGELPDNSSYGFGVDGERFDRRLEALNFMEGEFAKRTGAAEVNARRAVFERAVKMMRADELKAFDVSDEPAAVVDAYGKSNFGRGCLVARRLVEVGAPVVEVTLDGWDTHKDNFGRLQKQMKIMDGAMATLLDELQQRGRLKDTLVLWMGEFGRTPRINGNDGRDHHPRAWSAVLAGGGIRGGQVYGATDERGYDVATKPMQVPDLMATVMTQLGVEPDKIAMSPGGRPVAVTNRGKVVSELVG